jgi:hypothetical protein
MISIERCKVILNQYGDDKIADEEISQLRSLLADWAKITIEIEEIKKYDANKECGSICSCEHR